MASVCAMYQITQSLLYTDKADEINNKRLCETLGRSRRLSEVRITTFAEFRTSLVLDRMTDRMLECFETLRGVENVVFPMTCGVESTTKYYMNTDKWAITGTDKAREKARRIMTSRE